MTTQSIKVPTLYGNCVVLRGIAEPPRTLDQRLQIITYKVGQMNDHLFKLGVLDSRVHREELKTNTAETLCHLLTFAAVNGWDIPELVDLGFKKLADKFVEHEKHWK